jgi:hypothetical protein
VFASKVGQIQVRLRVDPVDPAKLGAAPDGLTVFGNAYRLRATYEPGGRAVDELLVPIDAYLVYPVTATLTSANHQLATSEDGRTWTLEDGVDSHALQQVEGTVPALGYVQVVGVLGSPTPSTSGGDGSSRTLALGLIVAAVCVGLLGAGLILRSRSTAKPSRRSGGRTSGRRSSGSG